MGILDRMKDGAKSAKTFGSGSFVNPGKGVLIVKELKLGGKEEGFHGGDTFVAELLVESCEGFGGLKDHTGKDKPAGNPVGSTVSYVEKLHGEWSETAYGRMLEFVALLTGETEESLAKQAEEKKCTPQEVLAEGLMAMATVGRRKPTVSPRGLRIRYSTFEKETKEEKKMITVPKFEAFPNSAETVAEARAKLGDAA